MRRGLLAVLAILCTVAGTVGGTLAFYRASATSDMNVQAGTLALEALRVEGAPTPGPVYYASTSGGALPSGPWVPGDSHIRTLRLFNRGSLDALLTAAAAAYVSGERALGPRMYVRISAPDAAAPSGQRELFAGSLNQLLGGPQAFPAPLAVPAGGWIDLTFTVTLDMLTPNAMQSKEIQANFLIDGVQARHVAAPGAAPPGAAVGAASPATSQITAAQGMLPADGSSTSTVTVQLRDAGGSPITAGGPAVTLTATAGSMGPVTDHGNGSYSAVLTASVTAGSAVVSGSVEGSPLVDTETVTFVAGSPSGTASVIDASAETIMGGAGGTSLITVRLRDRFGNLVESGSHDVRLATSLGDLSAVSYAGGAAYTATLSPGLTSGTATITGSVDGESITDTAVVQIQVPAPVDLRTWTRQGAPANGNWSVAADGRSVQQTLNGGLTFFVGAADYQNVIIRGKIKVETTTDDDLIGFVFGYQSPLASHRDAVNDYDFLLFDWKQYDQTDSGYLAHAGFGLSHVHGVLADTLRYFWGHTEDGSFDALDTNYSSVNGWKDNTEYRFELQYRPDQVQISIDGAIVLDVTGSFPAGRFGFYNYSQQFVRYSELEVLEMTP